MGNSKSSPRTPRAIQIKVNAVKEFPTEHSSNSNETEKEANRNENEIKEPDRSKSRVMEKIPEEQVNNLDDSGVDMSDNFTSASRTEFVRKDFESRCESVAKEIRLLSVTPSHAITPGIDRVSQKYRKNSDHDAMTRSTSPEDDVHVHHDAITPEIERSDSIIKLEKQATMTDIAFIDQNGNRAEEEKSTLPQVTVLFEKHWSASSPDDVIPCWIHGITTLSDGCVLILDLNNNALKLFDENQEFVCSKSVSEECIGISSVYSNEVAITCGNEVHFYFVDKTRFVLQQRCFKLNGQGFGICFAHKNYAVTCDIHKTSGNVRILNERGKQRYVIKSCRVFGALIKMSKFVQIDPSLDVVYISDAENGRIVSFTFDGQALWHHEIGDEPKALISFCSYLLVADFRKHLILQVSSDGRESRVILTDEDEIWSPDYVTHNSKTKQLFINTPDNVLVFKIL